MSGRTAKTAERPAYQHSTAGEKKKYRMYKKRTPPNRSTRHLVRKHLTSQQFAPEGAEKTVLLHLYRAKSPQILAELYAALASEELRKKSVQNALELLVQENLVSRDGRRRFSLHPEAHLGEGVLSQNPRGFGFVKLASQAAGRSLPGKDVFIPKALIGEARHGDRVLIRIIRTGSDGRSEGVVVALLSRGADTIAGIYSERQGEGLVYPDDPRFPFVMRVSGGLRAEEGDAVLVRYRGTSRSATTLPGEIVEVIGPADHIDSHLRLVVEKFSLPHQFSAEALAEAAALPEPGPPDNDRVDLRDVEHFTIDGESAEDFDDAIAICRTDRGYRLLVSIADVSFYVSPGSAIDQEAYLRGTSVYFPSRVLPMLPERLANHLCSLVPDEDRLAVTAVLDFDNHGKLLESAFHRSLIRSRHRFTYTTIGKILVDREPAIRTEHAPFLAHLETARELALALQSRRRQRGAVDFNLPEAEFRLDSHGRVAAMEQSKRTLAHQLVEEFMLAANEAVAGLFSAREVPALYRVHQPPDPAKAEEFVRFVRTLGLNPPPFVNSSAWFAEVVKASQENSHQYLISNLVLRSMQQAHYTSKNVGHFGLAAECYTHFTSPIRRYPDLLVHRTLLDLIAGKQPSPLYNGEPLEQAAEFLSAREREAVTAERDMHDRLKICYMAARVGETFPAVISGVTDSALFIELQELCLSGSIAVDELRDDCYLLDQKNYRLFGEIHARTYRIGDTLAVTLLAADTVRKRLHFTPADTANEANATNATIAAKSTKTAKKRAR